jgi:CrcB protein
MIINITGSFIMGAFIEILARRAGASNELRLFVATGILGGYTTFSAFSLDFAVLVERKAYTLAGAYALGSVVISLIAIFVGMALARALV